MGTNGEYITKEKYTNQIMKIQTKFISIQFQLVIFDACGEHRELCMKMKDYAVFINLPSFFITLKRL